MALKWMVVLCLVSFVLSCGGDRPIQIGIYGKEDMNNGYAVSIRVFQLKSDTTFRLLPITEFFRGDDSALKGDILYETQETIIPGERKPVMMKILEGARYIGAVANFNKPDKEGWRDIFPLDSKRPEEIWITIQANSIEIN
jgi:type VI secretion system protein VasD